MIYLALSDIHLNINRRLDDTEALLYQVTDLAHIQSVDKILIPGDIYHSRKPHSLERVVFCKWIRYTLQKCPNLSFVLMPGNHDEYPDKTNSLTAEFGVLGAERVKLVPNPYIEDEI